MFLKSYQAIIINVKNGMEFISTIVAGWKIYSARNKNGTLDFNR